MIFTFGNFRSFYTKYKYIKSPGLEQEYCGLVQELYKILPDFGEHIALDGKSIQSYANKNGKDEIDGRAEHDANWGKHVYSGIDANGKPWEKIKKWFGFKLHLLVDSKYELPISYIVTKAAKNEIPIAHKLIDNLSEEKKERAEYLSADRGLDDGKLHEKLWSSYGIKPIIDIRNLWKDPDKTKVLPGKENIVYDYKGTVECYCPKINKKRELAYGGFEQDRNTFKYRCPALHYGIECKGREDCEVSGSIRIPLKTDRRIFTPVARSSYKLLTSRKALNRK